MALSVFLAVILLGGVNPSLASVTVFLLAGVGVSVAIYQVFRPKIQLPNPTPILAVALFAGYAVVRWFWSFPKYEARDDVLAVALASIALLVPSIGLNSTNIRWLFVVGLTILATGQSGYGMWQAFSRADTVLIWDRPELYNGRGSGTYVCPNHFAGFLEMCLGMIVAQIIVLRKERRSIEASAIIKVMMIYAGLMTVGGLMVSQSRGGWLAALGGGAMAIFLMGRSSRTFFKASAVVAGLLVCAVLVLWNIPSIRNYLRATVSVDVQKQQVSLGDKTLGGRTLMWKGTLAIIRENPWFGTGLGSWRWQFQKHKDPQIMTFPEYPHNDYLNLASDYGLVGVVLMLLLFGSFFRHGIRVTLESNSSEERAFAAGTMVAASCILIHSWFDFNLHILGNALILATLMGMTIAIPLAGQRDFGRPATCLQHYGIPVMVAGLAGFVIYQFLPVFRAYRHFDQGLTAKAHLDYAKAVDEFEAASRIDPIFPSPHVRSGDVLKDQATWRIGPGKLAERREYAAKAAIAYGRALVLNPMHSDAWVSKGQALAMAGDAAGALASFQKAVEVAPVNAFAYFAMGKFLTEQGDDERALESYNKANQYFLGNEPMFYFNAYEVQEKIRAKPRN